MSELGTIDRPGNDGLLRLNPKAPLDLRAFLDGGAIEELAIPLDLLLAEGGKSPADSRVRLLEDECGEGGELQAYWHYGLEESQRRSLVIQSNLSYIAGLHLKIPVELEGYGLASGTISASYVPKIIKGRSRVGHYLKQGHGMEIGTPMTVVRVQRMASRQLLKACGVVSVKELDQKILLSEPSAA